MEDFIRNGISFPRRAPRLNTSHPFYGLGGQTILAAVATPSGGMTDLVTGVTSTNTATKTEVNEIGPCVWGNAVDSSTFLTWPLIGQGVSGITQNYLIATCIFKFVAAGTQYLISPASGFGLRIVSSNLSWSVSNGSSFTYALTLNHSYYVVIFQAVGAASAQRQFMVHDLTSGQVFTGSASGSIFTMGQINVLQLNDALTGPANRIAAVSVTVSNNVPPSSTNTPTYPTLGTLHAARLNPWSLWYA